MNIARIKQITPDFLISWYHLVRAWIGATRYGHPSKELIVIGITGTSGKSTTVSFLRELLEAAGHTVGSLSTVDFCIAGKSVLNNKKMTMLGHAQIQKYLRQMVDSKCTVAIVESTSQGALQHRHRFIHFDVFGLTNLYHEHIEAHGGYEPYKQAKISLFTYTAGLSKKILQVRPIKHVAVINADIPEYKEFALPEFDEHIFFGTEQSTQDIDLKYTEVKQTKKGLQFVLNGAPFTIPNVHGVHNAGNIVCSVGLARAIGVQEETIFSALPNLTPVAGRLEFIPEAKKKGFDVIVDYAFEPVALQALYDTILPLDFKRIIHVLGATGGGRDVSRRLPMGNIAGKHANTVIITNEDPYDEDPRSIMKDVEQGVVSAGLERDKEYFMVLDRSKAIQKAVNMANKDDIILITGKGSEQGMVVKNNTILPWDDRKKAITAIKKYDRQKK